MFGRWPSASGTGFAKSSAWLGSPLCRGAWQHPSAESVQTEVGLNSVSRGKKGAHRRRNLPLLLLFRLAPRRPSLTFVPTQTLRCLCPLRSCRSSSEIEALLNMTVAADGKAPLVGAAVNSQIKLVALRYPTVPITQEWREHFPIHQFSSEFLRSLFVRSLTIQGEMLASRRPMPRRLEHLRHNRCTCSLQKVRDCYRGAAGHFR